MTNIVQKVVWHDASYSLPPKYESVLVSGGVAYWDGENWITRMEPEGRQIEWPVLYWTEIPQAPIKL